ncbi:Serine carboxypeptidase, serine active site,Serine carboxypeptidases, histidine active [Cinara cedri]|uniref:Carboxypeptidase n=1 Tax=Cinara cedri TaxID=506608 RepID=A0A5E4MJX0_9HEMI|nr:Serine carboxypeptidase, serine active site,Serine carboxypeptidases, histidine active [Cinara cedri]
MRFAGSLIAFVLCCDVWTAAGQFSEDDGALYLTPMIRANKIKEARAACAVKPLKADIKSYSGYLTVNDTTRSNLFFWFFPAMEDDANAPVLLWLQGGPGASSLYGLFEEHGPFSVGKSHGLKLRNHTWVYQHSVLYVDNPVGTGFSFTEDDAGYSTEQGDVGLNMYVALVQFFTLFPEYQKNDFFVTGESYAGKYVTAVSYAIHLNNPNAALKINLKGLAIGNGLIDPINQLVYSEYLYEHGFLDDDGKHQFELMENKARAEILSGDYTAAFNTFDMLLNADVYPYPSLFKNLTGFGYYFNMLFDRDPSVHGNWSTYVQGPTIRSSLHVGNRSLNNGIEVERHLLNDVMQSMSSWLAALLNTGKYRVLLYSGQLDIIVPYRGTMCMAKSLKWSGADKFKNATRTIWRLTEPGTNSTVVAGYATTSGPLTVVLVRNAGHMVPGDQPISGIDLINRFTTGKSF